MKIGLLSSESSELSVMPRVVELLQKRIHGIEVLQKTAKNNLDLPAMVSSLKGCEHIVVAVYYPQETVDVKVLMEKLVELDLKGQRNIKFIMPSEDLDEKEEASRIVDSIVEKISGKKP